MAIQSQFYIVHTTHTQISVTRKTQSNITRDAVCRNLDPSLSIGFDCWTLKQLWRGGNRGGIRLEWIAASCQSGKFHAGRQLCCQSCTGFLIV